MWKWLIRRSKKGGIGGVLTSLVLVAVVCATPVIGFFLACLTCMEIEKVIGKGSVMEIICGLVLPILIFAPLCSFINAKKQVEAEQKTSTDGTTENATKSDKNDDKESTENTSDSRIAMGDEAIPHFGKLLKESQIEHLLEEEVFQKYKYKTGATAEYVQVSIDGKWIRLGENNLPLDFICGYNKSMNELYTIDGETLALSDKTRKGEIRTEIENFFEERGTYFKTAPFYAKYEFGRIVEKCGTDLAKADWSKIRYNWEKIYAKTKRPGRKRLKEEAFKRVLIREDILRIVRLIQKKAGKAGKAR